MHKNSGQSVALWRSPIAVEWLNSATVWGTKKSRRFPDVAADPDGLHI